MEKSVGEDSVKYPVYENIKIKVSCTKFKERKNNIKVHQKSRAIL